MKVSSESAKLCTSKVVADSVAQAIDNDDVEVKITFSNTDEFHMYKKVVLLKLLEYNMLDPFASLKNAITPGGHNPNTLELINGSAVTFIVEN